MTRAGVLMCWFAVCGFDFCSAQIDRAQVELAKNATALVERPSGDGFGSSFCISKSGFFITNEHVIEGESEKIPLIINPGTAQEKKLLSTIVRKDEKKDLALLKLEDPPADLKVLELGNDDALFETQQVSVFGYPFGTALALKNKKYPSISINVGRITSLRKNAGVLKTIQIDAVVNPGNSGGPMLADDGKVIGVVVEKVRGTDVNFSIPVTDVKEFLNRPDLFLASPSIRFAKRQDPTKLRFGVTAFGSSTEKYRLELRLSNGLEKTQTLTLNPDAKGDFVAEIFPEKKKELPLRFPVTVSMESGTIKGEMIEQRVKVGASIQYLVEMKSFAKSSDNQWMLVRYDGKKAKIDELRFEVPEIWLGKSKLDLDLSTCKKIEIGVPSGRFPKQLSYEAKIFGAKGLVASTRGKIPFVGAPGGTDSAVVDADKEDGGTDVAKRGGYALPQEQPSFKDVTLVYQFDKPFNSYSMAGADRYAVFKFEESRSVQIFDLIQGKVVHTINDVDSDAIICGGSEHLFITLPSQMLVQRYSLGDWKREKISRLPIKNSPKQVHIGANADNHLFIFDGFELHIVDTERLKPIPVLGEPLYKSRRLSTRQIDISADGRVIGTIPKGYGPVNHEALFIGKKFLFKQTLSSTSNAVRWANPSPHGRIFFMKDGKIESELGKDISAKWLEGTQLYPTVDPRYFISVNFVESKDRKWSTHLRVCTASDFRVIHSMTELEELKPSGNTRGVNDVNSRLHYRRTKVHYVPWANVLFNAGYDNKTIYVRKYDVEKELQATGEDYLFVDSLPPFAAFKNITLKYQISSKTNAKSVKYSLSEGPSGMRVTPEGMVTWRPPRGMPVGIVPVIVTIESDKGDENIHTFELAVLPSTEKRR